jgi:hypothetical protein
MDERTVELIVDGCLMTVAQYELSGIKVDQEARDRIADRFSEKMRAYGG